MRACLSLSGGRVCDPDQADAWVVTVILKGEYGRMKRNLALIRAQFSSKKPSERTISDASWEFAFMVFWNEQHQCHGRSIQRIGTFYCHISECRAVG